MADDQILMRAFRFAVDPSATQERLLRSYCGSARRAFNWALDEVTDNLAVRASERDAGVRTDQLTQRCRGRRSR
jgi:putative transposase